MLLKEGKSGYARTGGIREPTRTLKTNIKFCCRFDYGMTPGKDTKMVLFRLVLQ